MMACMQVALFALGPGVFHPSEATAAVIRQCMHQARDGRIPDAATKAITWMTGPENKLPLAYEVDLRIIGSAILGASFVSYLLKVMCTYHLCHVLSACIVSQDVQGTCAELVPQALDLVPSLFESSARIQPCMQNTCALQLPCSST